ncbi:Glutamyl-tRNA(Gln) amidotransferase subunit C [Candidatus Kinetoplastibacterium sorsogonicusi]|uniref:Glutamyl-tRNA(Gln) amidotransferase subunit C n=1 Tax=Candidatus Kinetoplastidibacterium kentomonadis TaxID=1576550 RepID=A0A3Q8ERZ8_9PROT|nr:Asp-tRNA(Asn)/Glu-tRNA(Gln) amidotransferase subunit GatC [Candidatus Kinetoplastibacterium sorsogonicusi]AWD32738.1 Glutamyl-tRNA(Gln) amidotransferase subunit C [Candidatus Kinetoplastibacterium sorsogonicusi]
MILNQKNIKNIANIAKIDLQDKQLELMTHEINNLLKIISKIDLINTDKVEELINPILSYQDETLFLRKDEVNFDQESNKTILKNAPEINNNLFLVPIVIE